MVMEVVYKDLKAGCIISRYAYNNNASPSRIGYMYWFLLFLCESLSKSFLECQAKTVNHLNVLLLPCVSVLFLLWG